MTPGASEDAFEATVEEVVFTSDDGAFAVVHGKRASDEVRVTLVGDLAGFAPGETVRVRGRWTEHAVYGRRFRATAVTPILPSTQTGIARYLGSGLVPGIGPALAERLVERFGERTLDIIANESARLRDVEGIGAKRAASIAEAVRSRRDEAETLAYLHSVEIGPALGRRILKRLGPDTMHEVRTNPYGVAERVAGMGFRTADRVGRAQGIGPDDPRRAEGAALHVVAASADDGHTYLDAEALLERAAALDVPRERVEAAVTALAGRGMLVVDGPRVYAPPLYRAEIRVAAAIARMAADHNAQLPPNVAANSAQGEGPTLTETQWQAVGASLAHRLTVLTGGPGTGKTTTVRAVVEAHLREGKRVALAAPTGRAAKRLFEATGHEAKTIHRLLEWNPATGDFQRDERSPIEAELVLVDESSMLDILLADRLLAAVAPNAHLMFVGDIDQLPPVGPGPVLREVLESGAAYVVRLEEIFRQAQRSAIVRGAHAILAGRLPEASTPGASDTGDLHIVSASDPERATDRILAALSRVRDAYGLDPKRDVQVLTPMRRGALGTDELNLALQDALTPLRGPASTTGYRVGDKVMQLRNDYDRDVYNGDLGEVRRMEGGILYVGVDGREVQYNVDALHALTLAYASTVHKVQGSEFPAVIIVLHTSHFVLLSRALLYTAVTRAKRLVVLVADERALRRAVENDQAYTVNAHLAHRIAAARRALAARET